MTQVSHAVFTEQESSASRVTVVKVLDVIVKLLWVAGQADEFVSACTQGKTEDTPKLLQVSELKCAVDISGQKFGENIRDSVVPLGRNVYAHLLTGLPSEETVRKGSTLRQMWESFNLGLSARASTTRTLSFRFSWTIWRWQGQSRSHVEKIDGNELILRTNANKSEERFLEIPSRYASILSDD